MHYYPLRAIIFLRTTRQGPLSTCQSSGVFLNLRNEQSWVHEVIAWSWKMVPVRLCPSGMQAMASIMSTYTQTVTSMIMWKGISGRRISFLCILLYFSFMKADAKPDWFTCPYGADKYSRIRFPPTSCQQRSSKGDIAFDLSIWYSWTRIKEGKTAGWTYSSVPTDLPRKPTYARKVWQG
jgi:hypothetical protein